MGAKRERRHGEDTVSFLCDEKQRDIILFILCSLSNRGASDSAAFAALFAALLPFCSGASERVAHHVTRGSHPDVFPIA